MPYLSLSGLDDGLLPLIVFCLNPLPIQCFLLNIVNIGYIPLHYCNLFVLRVVLRVEEAVADKGRVDVISIRFSVFVWTVKRGVFLLLIDLLIDVYPSSRGAFGELLT